jgi:acyl carrier protein
MPNTESILPALKKIVEERFNIDTTGFTEQTKLRDLGLDSMHVVDILLDIEEMFGFKILDLSLPNDATLGEICAEISKNFRPAASST